MNIRDSDMHDPDMHDHDFPSALRWQLRGLRQDAAPGNDLWPGIAARVATQPVVPARRPMRWLSPLALAASLVLAVGTVGWFARGPQTAATAAAPSLVQLEADGLARQYQAALQEVRAPVPASLKPTAEALDRDLALIHAALARDSDSVRLLEQLRRTYARRLALAQRIAYA